MSTPRGPGRRLTAADRLILLNGVSTFGSGLVYPYTALYLSELPEMGAAGVSVFYGAAAAANLLTAAVLATGWIKPSPARLGFTGTLMLAVGFLGTAAAGSLTALFAAVLFVGCGQGCLLVSMVPVLSSLTSQDQRRSVFARRYQAINVGLGLGAVVAGLTTGFFTTSAVPWLFVANALSYLPLAYAFHRLRARERREEVRVAEVRVAEREETVEAREAAGGRLKWLGTAGALAVLFQLGAYLFGHSQFEATSPLVAVRLMGIGLGAVSALLLVNTAVVALGQSWVTRLLSSRDETFGLRAAVLLWVAAYAVAMGSAFGPQPVRYAGLLLFAVVFAIGECAYSCSFHPWLIDSVEAKDVTRVSALASGAMGIGTAAGPSIGVALTLTGEAFVVWLSLASLCLLLLLTLGRRRVAVRRPADGTAGATPEETPASHTGDTT
ncbi:MFS transporter [Streptomyces sp. NPDC058221]|uniref:MFS transporter n=1 Tax=Streptomyces sp. NPDC058221 TaxID=3346388 RepID=UPI0036E3B69A